MQSHSLHRQQLNNRSDSSEEAASRTSVSDNVKPSPEIPQASARTKKRKTISLIGSVKMSKKTALWVSVCGNMAARIYLSCAESPELEKELGRLKRYGCYLTSKENIS